MEDNLKFEEASRDQELRSLESDFWARVLRDEEDRMAEITSSNDE